MPPNREDLRMVEQALPQAVPKTSSPTTSLHSAKVLFEVSMEVGLRALHRQIPDFVHDEPSGLQLRLQFPLPLAAHFRCSPLLDQRVEGGEVRRVATRDRLDAQCAGQVGFAHAWWPQADPI